MDIMQEILKEVKQSKQDTTEFKDEVLAEVRQVKQDTAEFKQEMAEFRGEMTQFKDEMYQFRQENKEAHKNIDAHLASVEETVQEHSKTLEDVDVRLSSVEESVKSCREFNVLVEYTFMKKAELFFENVGDTIETNKDCKERIGKLERRVGIHELRLEGVDNRLAAFAQQR